MTTITAHNDTTIEGAGATEFEIEATDTRQVDSMETVQVDPAPGTIAAAPPLPGQPQAAAQPQPQPPAQTSQGSAFAITSFVLGIASIVSGWTFFAPIAGLILGILALRRGTTERTLALWGVWLNGVMLALSLIGIVVFGALLGAGMLALPFLA